MISVCLPTYNGSKYIIQQLNSILSQLSDEDEVIVSDDCSEDNTCELVENLKDKRIVILREKKFPNYVFNFEHAIKNAKGDLIFLCDQDDVWLPNKVEVMSRHLKEFDLVLSDCFVTDSDLTVVHPSYFSIRKTVQNKYLSLIAGSPYLGCCIAFKRSVLSKALPFPQNVNSHDIWIGNIAAFFYKVKFIDDKLIYYRRHNGNTSNIAGASQSSGYAKMKDRLTTIVNLLYRMWRV